LIAVTLAIPVLDWGLPPTLREVVASDLRCSYALDEDDILTAASFTNPAKFEFDGRLYHWGTFHIHLTHLVLDGGELLHYFDGPWRASYYNMIPGQFERVYRLGRMLSMLFGLLCVAAVYWLGLRLGGPQTALWAAAMTAASPAYLLASVQVRSDMTMVALVVIAACFGLRAMETGSVPSLFAFGVASGLAITAKYPALLVVVAMLIIMLYTTRSRQIVGLVTMVGGTIGVLAGQPYLITRWAEMFRQVSDAANFGKPIPAPFGLSAPALLSQHAENVFRFLLAPVATLASLGGLVLLARRRSAAAAFVFAGVTGSVLTLLPLKWPLLRYDLLLLPWLALAAAFALAHLESRWRWPLAIAAVAMPLAASLAQVRYMRQTHPANAVLKTILDTVPPGTPITRLVREIPPLDQKVYPMGRNPLLDDLTQDRPEWVLTTDLPDTDYPAATTQLLTTKYEQVARFQSERTFSWATLGESGAPHDWKYTHPTMSLYRRRFP
jgi:hypothetical protein